MQTDTSHPKPICPVVQLLAFQSQSWILWWLQEGRIRYLGGMLTDIYWVLCKICSATTKAMINWNCIMDARNCSDLSSPWFCKRSNAWTTTGYDVLKVYNASARLVHCVSQMVRNFVLFHVFLSSSVAYVGSGYEP